MLTNATTNIKYTSLLHDSGTVMHNASSASAIAHSFVYLYDNNKSSPTKAHVVACLPGCRPAVVRPCTRYSFIDRTQMIHMH